MPEVVAWPEALISLYTGAGMTSAVVSYAQNVNLIRTWGYMNIQALNNTYRDHLTGQRADLTIGRFWNYDGTLTKLLASATAVHVKIVASALGVSAGVFLYSGRFDVETIAGAGAAYAQTLTYHANYWSAF